MCKEHREHHHTHHEKKEAAGIFISHHEGATVFTVTRGYPLSYEEMLAIIPERLQQLSAWVEENGGFVGHIKGSVTDVSRCAMLSTTGGACSIKETTSPSVKLRLTCIIFMFTIDEEKMCSKIDQTLALLRS